MSDFFCLGCCEKLEGIVEALKLRDEVELEWGASHPLELIEELRLTLKSFLRREVLDSLLNLYKLLEQDPKQSEAFCYFIGHSEFGSECRYAISALESFKVQRLDRTIELLESCLVALKEMRGYLQST